MKYLVIAASMYHKPIHILQLIGELIVKGYTTEQAETMINKTIKYKLINI